MYQTFCQTLFHMTWAAAVAALGVMVLRLVLRRAPRGLVCVLWLVVFLRMVCPVSFTLPVSLIPDQPQVFTSVVSGTAAEQRPVNGASAYGSDHTGMDTDRAPAAEPPASLQVSDPYAAWFLIWACGAAFMGLWAVLSYASLRRRVSEAVRVEDRVYESDRIDSPFVCGVFRPRIYLPAGLSGADKKNVLLHERAHIARGDPACKLLAWLALSFHWFNPVLWAAFVLFGRDTETACDQRVIQAFDREDVAGYAAALLHLGRRNAVPRAVPLAFGEEDARGRIRHVMDFKHPHILVVVLAAAVCVAVGALLLANPGERNDQIDGVQMTKVRILDRGAPVDLPEHLAHEVIPLIRRYDTEQFYDLESYLPAPGDLVLSDQRGGTVFYLTSSLDRELVLVRFNHDTMGWTSPRKGVTMTGLKDDPAYQRWADDAERYLEEGRADDLYELKTAYIGNHIAAGEILSALNVAEVAGPYTIELQTQKAPYGITLHLENVPSLEGQAYHDQYLRQAGILFIALVDNASFFNWDYVDGTAGGGIHPGMQKPVGQETFREMYSAYRQALGTILPPPAVGQTARYSFGQALYLSPEMPWRDMPMYIGSATMAGDLFSVQYTHALSSAMPTADSYANPVYRQMEVPDKIILKDESWPTQEALDQFTSYGREGSAAPVTWSGALPLDTYRDRICIVVCHSKNQETPYRLYRLDGELWLSHETGGTADWVFALSDQPSVPLSGEDAEE